MDDQSTVIIKPKKQNTLLLLAMLFIVIPAVTYYFFRQAEQKPFYWVDIGLFMVLWVLVVLAGLRRLSYSIRGKNINDAFTVKLTPQGFYKGETLYRWHDINYFGVRKEFTTLFSLLSDARVVCWKYKPALSSLQFREKLARFLSGYDDELSAKYELEPDALAKLLNEWRERYTGQPSEVEAREGFNRKLTTKEVIFALVFTGLLIFAIVAITALFINK